MNAVYFWLGLGFLLCAAETLMPGIFLLWLGLAGLATGLAMLALPELGGIAQIGLYGVFAAVSVLISKQVMRGSNVASDRPMLNRKADQMIGRTYPLEEAIDNGFGKLKAGDALWTVSGEDLPAGTQVTVVAVEGMQLKVERAG